MTCEHAKYASEYEFLLFGILSAALQCTCLSCRLQILPSLVKYGIVFSRSKYCLAPPMHISQCRWFRLFPSEWTNTPQVHRRSNKPTIFFSILCNGFSWERYRAMKYADWWSPHEKRFMMFGTNGTALICSLLSVYVLVIYGESAVERLESLFCQSACWESITQ